MNMKVWLRKLKRIGSYYLYQQGVPSFLVAQSQELER